jgi:4-hydroxybutyryl-CoA dehydratase/vinylacetyl-CoA-Delta-isomerase
MIRTPEQYVESLRDGRIVYQDGQKLDDITAYPPYKAAIERAASEYYLKALPQNRSLFCTVEDGEEFYFIYKVPKTPEDIQRRRTIIQTLMRSGAAATSLTGIDGLNGVAWAAGKMDAALGTNYRQRVEEFRKLCQKTDPSICAAVSDPKGHRGLHADDPRQKHKDFYLRIVDRTKDGIFINGCKLHISESILANWLICLPSRNHEESERDYAVACAVPCNAKGVKFIATDSELASGGGHPMIIFDNVFVPNERVFMAGEWQFSRLMATSFARYHRLTAATYKSVQLQIVAGLAMLMAEYNGLTHATRIRDMLAWLAMYADMTEALGKAAALDAKIDPETGLAAPNVVYTNCAKFWFADNWHQAMKYLQDITGGIAATMPSMKDWENPETRPYIEKYLAGDARYPTEERLRALLMVRRLGSTFNGILSIHAEGSLAAQRMTIYQMADWERFKAAARRAMGLPTDHPEFKDLPTEAPWKMPERGQKK